MIDINRLQTLAAGFGIELSNEAAEKMDIYAALLAEWNQKMNLTAIKEPEEVMVKHFLDSLTVATVLPKGPFKLIDVGTGAGFPGVPLAILRPDIELTLLDSLNKRLVFLETVCRETGVTANRVHARAEEFGKKAEFAGQFDVATARAVAAMEKLAGYLLPFVKKGGKAIAMKGPDGSAETETAAKTIAKFGGKWVDTVTFTLPKLPRDGDRPPERQLIVLEKIK